MLSLTFKSMFEAVSIKKIQSKFTRVNILIELTRDAEKGIEIMPQPIIEESIEQMHPGNP